MRLLLQAVSQPLVCHIGEGKFECLDFGFGSGNLRCAIWDLSLFVLYLPSIPVDRTLRQQLVEAVLSRNIEQLLTVLPRCEKEDVNAPIDFPKDRRTVVHLACGIGAPEILQLLIWYNADLSAVDEHGRNALWHANLSGSAECAAILIQQGGLQPEQKPQQQKHSTR
ncbi:hypothetical protein niasHT_030180 [Heterodera trifolii]|uniref:Uncharacterized protein n=1 Tax=Heterodera trifolii TaxID=157864 RepID=A0ABD2K2S5_9BILA